jgi:LPS-assembly protein
MKFLKQLSAVIIIINLFCFALLSSEAAADVLTDYERPEFSPYSKSDDNSGKNEKKSDIPSYQKFDKEAPVDISADSLHHDDKSQVITAEGNVELTQGGRTLRADEVKYHLVDDKVIAKGKVILHEPNGDVHFVDELKLGNKMREGFIKGLKSYLSGGGMFVAESGEMNDNVISMRNASYTPCNCDNDEDGNPAWQIKAGEVNYLRDENRISYKNPRFEIFGTPVAWLPFLSHPDGQVKRKSGFLSPDVGFDSELGFVFIPSYYWDIAPNKDLTLGVIASSQEDPVLLTEYRHRFTRADLKLDGSISHSARTDSVAGVEIRQDEDWRGHLFADGLWDINNKLRAGIDIELTSDEQYLRQFDISGQSLLESKVYLERFSGRNYAVAEAIAFQDTRIDREEIDQPNILPRIKASFFGEPNKMLGGRWALDLSALSLARDGNGQDVSRFVAETGWFRKYISDIGLVTAIDTLLRADAYRTNDRDVAPSGSGRSGEGTETRTFAQAHIINEYPLVKEYENSQAVIKPIAAFTLSSNANVSDSDIPNEDSQDVQIDASNLFEANRYPGKDRIEDGIRATYGIQAGLYGHEGSSLDLFVGQSYHFDNNTNFPEGSGLSEKDSDVVGQIAGVYDDRYGLTYRFQLSNEDLSSQRHEFDAFVDGKRLYLTSRYLFASALAGTDISESREQVMAAGSYKIMDKWKLNGGALYDLGSDPGLRKAGVGIDYGGCCTSFSLSAKRTLTSEASGDSGTDISFRIGLKNIGEFKKSGSMLKSFSSAYSSD